MFYENVMKLCEEKGISIARMEREAGIANATARGWAMYTPNVRTIVKVADYFGVSVDYLLGRGTCGLSTRAQQYAKLFDELPEDKKQLAIAYMGVVQAQQ